MFGLPLQMIVGGLVVLVAGLVYMVARMAAQLDEMQTRLDYACLKASQLSNRADAEDRQRAESERPHLVLSGDERSA